MMDEDTFQLLAQRVYALENRVDSLDKDVQPPKPVGEFGEPWERKLDDIVFASPHEGGCDELMVGWRSNNGARKHLDRAIACVNANAGIKNVAEVPKILTHLRELLADAKAYNSSAKLVLGGHTEALLSALDTPPDGEGSG